MTLHDGEEWPTAVIKSWTQFVQWVSSLVVIQPRPVRYLFRGQPKAEWALVPFLHRIIRTNDPVRAIQIEQSLDREFRAEGPLSVQDPVTAVALNSPSILERLAFMRHFGVPTRILDWTSSPYVAAYFAAAEEPAADGAVFVVHPATANEAAGLLLPNVDSAIDERFSNPDSPDEVTFFSPDIRALRTSIQQGHFSLNTRPLANHDRPLLKVLLPKEASRVGTHCHKWILPSAQKDSFLNSLRLMNITPQALFPGPDGLGRTLADMVRLDLLRND